MNIEEGGPLRGRYTIFSAIPDLSIIVSLGPRARFVTSRRAMGTVAPIVTCGLSVVARPIRRKSVNELVELERRGAA